MTAVVTIPFHVEGVDGMVLDEVYAMIADKLEAAGFDNFGWGKTEVFDGNGTLVMGDYA